MDYDKSFEKNINEKSFYSDYPGNKLVVGKISLKNALARMGLNEYYTLVTYSEDDILPDQYVPINELECVDGNYFATVNPNIRLSYICREGGIQVLSKLPSTDDSPRYLLGPGPDTVTLNELIMEQFDKIYNQKSHNRL